MPTEETQPYDTIADEPSSPKRGRFLRFTRLLFASICVLSGGFVAHAAVTILVDSNVHLGTYGDAAAIFTKPYLSLVSEPTAFGVMLVIIPVILSAFALFASKDQSASRHKTSMALIFVIGTGLSLSIVA